MVKEDNNRIEFVKNQIDYFTRRLETKQVSEPEFFVNTIMVYEKELQMLEAKHDKQKRR